MKHERAEENSPASLSKPFIPTLESKRGGFTETRFHLAVSGASNDESVHGFAVVVDDPAGGVLATISFASRAAGTTHMRGGLGSALTALEFIDRNCEPGAYAVIYSNVEYVWKWLRPNSSTWLRQKQRANKDILRKIAPLLVKLPDVSFLEAAARLRAH